MNLDSRLLAKHVFDNGFSDRRLVAVDGIGLAVLLTDAQVELSGEPTNRDVVAKLMVIDVVAAETLDDHATQVLLWCDQNYVMTLAGR